MRTALIVVAVVVGFLAIQAGRANVMFPSGFGSMLTLALFAISAGLLAAVALSSGRLRDLLPVRIVRIWLNRARAWADSQEHRD